MTLPPLWGALAGVLVGIAAATFAGWAVVRRFAEGLTGRETLAWSLAAGLLLQAALLLVLLALRSTPTAGRLVFLEVVIAAAGLLIGRHRRRPAPGWIPGRRRDPLVLALGAVAGGAWLLFLLTALADAPWATDFLAIWGLKAKLIFLTSSVPGRLFHDPALAFGHPEYPLLLPLSLSSLAVVAGSWNDQALALFYPVCALATLLGLSGFLSRRVSPRAGAVAAALAALCVPLYRPASVGTAEIPFAFGAVLAAAAASDVLGSPSGGALPRLAFATLFCGATKQEGTLLAAFLGIALAVRLWRFGQRRAAAALAAAIVPVAALGLLQRQLRGAVPSRDFDLSLLFPSRWPELPGRFGASLLRILETDARAAIVPVLAVALFFAATRSGALDWVAPVLAAQLLAYVAAFTVSAFGPQYAVDAAFSRISMTLFPAFTLVLAARLPGGPSAPETRASRLSLVRPPVETAPRDPGGG